MKRPFFIWVTILLTLLGDAYVVRFYLGGGDPLIKGAPLEVIEALRYQTSLEQGIGILRLVLSSAAAVALFLLRSVALPIFAVIFVLSILQFTGTPFPHLVSIWPGFIGPIVNGSILCYVGWLKWRGILRSGGIWGRSPN